MPLQNVSQSRRCASGLPLPVFLAAALSLGVGLSTAAAEDWAQFRGPNCAGVTTSKAALPLEFSDTLNAVWSADVGDGIGSPVVAAGRVFVSGMTGDEQVSLFCFDAKTGARLWKREFDTGELPEIHKTNSHASTTPAADSERVYFYFSTLGLRAFDAHNGRDAWHCDLPVPYFVFKWGAGMSPVLYEDMVVFCQDDDLNPALYAIDKATGKIRWQADRSSMAVNYSHPVICETETGTEIVVAGTGKLIGYDPQTGQQKWYANTLLRNIKTTPICRDGVVYISLQSGGIANQWLATSDKNSDGKLTKEEMQTFVGDVTIPAAFLKKFDRGDTNNDGFLEGEELDKAFLDPDNFAGARYDDDDPSDQFILAVRGGGKGDVTETHVLWKHESRAPDHICSPLVTNDRMLVVKGGGIASCFSTESGEPVWDQKRIQNVGEYFASPIAGDGKIYVTGENGTIVVLKDSAELEVLAKNDMGESCLATPAIADGRLIVRTRTKLISLGETPRPPLPESAGPVDKDAPKSYSKTESGLEYRILRKSDGKKPAPTDKVLTHYHGWTNDATVFDSSYNRGEPIAFPLNAVISGWTEGLQLIGEGGMIELKIPSKLAYGERGAPPKIGPNETLNFLVELKEIR